jgi:hypothetical protein
MTNNRICFFIFALIACVSCKQEPEQNRTWQNVRPSDYIRSQVQPATETDIIGIWRYPGLEFPPMEMHFNADHSLNFKKGFEDYNPATWQYKAATAELILSIPKMKAEVFKILNNNRGPDGKWINYADPENKIVSLPVEKQTNRIDFNGYIYYKEN